MATLIRVLITSGQWLGIPLAGIFLPGRWKISVIAYLLATLLIRTGFTRIALVKYHRRHYNPFNRFDHVTTIENEDEGHLGTALIVFGVIVCATAVVLAPISIWLMRLLVAVPVVIVTVLGSVFVNSAGRRG